MTIKLFAAVTTAIFGATCVHASSVLPTGGLVLHGGAQIAKSTTKLIGSSLKMGVYIFIIMCKPSM
ncbi:MAG: hypothetical protein SPJ14_01270 [Succinivibrio sp.]|nr:hypothetical protein [Succinivibrio sp.]